MTTANIVLPWHVNHWRNLWDAKQKDRLPHAFLFVGGCDLEKKHFARCLSAALLCAKPSDLGYSCQKCHACHLINAQSHPDLWWIEPEEAGQIIKIDQIRDVVVKASETSMLGGLRVVILSPAHAMTMAASNALLKTLEEPSSGTFFILMSDQYMRLPATISSRCQRVMFYRPSHEIAKAWLQSQHADKFDVLLKLADGFPLKALALQTEAIMELRQNFYQGLSVFLLGKCDPLWFATQCQTYDVLVLLKLLQSWLRDLLRYQLTCGEAPLINSDYRTVLVELAQVISLKNSVDYAEVVQKAYIKVLNRFNLNKQLLLEELWITWARYVSC